MEMVQSESSSEVTLNDEYVVNFVMGGFGGNVSVCSFNASKGYWIELELSSSSNDAFKVFLDILSANHGIIFSTTGKNFSQTVYLDYEDTYEITISKSPFYSSVRVRGTISVFHQETSGQSSSGNWVEVARFTGMGRLETDSFDCTHVDWRIRWSFNHSIELGPLGPPLAFTLQVYTVSGERVESLTLNYNRTGSFWLSINEMYVDNWSVIVEQNIDSIPEFPSWTILVVGIFLVSIIVITYRRSANQG